jgi:hypothetical protein
MSARKPLVAQLDKRRAHQLFSWLVMRDDVLWLSHAPGARENNKEALSAATRMLRSGLNSTADFNSYNKTLSSLSWCAAPVCAPRAGDSYLLWHLPSGPIEALTDIPGCSRPIENPAKGWLGPCSGSNAGYPAVKPATSLLEFSIASTPAWFLTVGVPAPHHEKTTSSLKAFLKELRGQLTELVGAA